MLKLLRGQRSDLELQMEFAAIVPELAEIGLELEDIQDILDDPNLAKSFIEDLKDGNLEAEELNTYLQQMKALKQIKINIELSTEEGIRNQFDELYNQANELFDIQRDIVRDSYEDQISDAEDAVESINDEIDSINTTIEDKQADIARMFDRPIANIQEQIEDMQRSIEMQFERPMQEMRESMSDLQRRVELEFDRPIERLREESGLLANDLQLIDKAAEDINDKYDAQQDALDKVSKLNQEIINQQKSQLDLADALSQGDIASAAQLAQQMRAESAQAYVDSTAEALDAARETQIGALRSARGMTRDEIADRQFDIEQEIFKLEEDRKDLSEEIKDIEDEIYELQEQQEEKLIEIRDLEDEIYRIEQKREPALKEIEELQIQIGNIERGNLRTAEDRLKVIQDQEQAELDAIDAKQEAWDDARLFAQQAAIDAGEYNDVLTMTKDLMDGTLDSWEAIKDKVVELKIKQVYLPPEGTPVSPGYEPGPGTGTGSGPDPAPAPTNSMTGDPIKDRDILKERAQNVQQASYGLYSAAIAGKLADYEKYYNGAMNATSIQAAMYFTPLLKAAHADLDSALTSVGFSQGGQVKGYGMGGMVAKYAMGGNVMKLAQGGMFKSLGSDIVPAMLTPGEFVIKRAAVNEIGVDKLEKLNSTGEMNDGSVYNYSVNVNVSSDANPDDIARTVISQIKRIDSQRIKGNRF